jgi:hypothetical protein
VAAIIDTLTNVGNNEESTKLVGGCTGKGFLPGKSGNPSGRPKKKPLTEALEKIYNNPKECMAAARALAKMARKGSLAHFQEAANRLEGKVGDDESSDGKIVVVFNMDMPRPYGSNNPDTGK